MTVEGKGGISAKVIADSISNISNQRITTYELVYPRFIHAEFMTHRQFSRNAASSRAIPVQKMLEMIRNNPAKPIHWGKNQPGMQAREELSGGSLEWTQWAWKQAADFSIEMADQMDEVEAHKQIVNRILEPYQFIKVVCTATEFENFFWLRCHADAQPEIKELADCMWKAREQSTPEALKPGEWHTPYVEHMRDEEGVLKYIVPCTTDGVGYGHTELSLEEALKVSASCCAQVSYRLADDSLEKAEKIYQQLVESKPVHASPFEHQATPMKGRDSLAYRVSQWMLEEGVTHISRPRDIDSCDVWSGNFCGWIQHRQLIPEHTKW